MRSEAAHGKIAALMFAQSTLRQVRDLMQQQGLDSPVYFIEMAYVVVSDTLRKTTDDTDGSQGKSDRTKISA